MTNPTRKTKLDDLAAMIEARGRLESLPHHAQMRERLHQLRTFIRQLADTDQGRLDLEQRLVLLGPCEPDADEPPADFYGKLRRWLDRDLTKHVRYASEREPIASAAQQAFRPGDYE